MLMRESQLQLNEREGKQRARGNAMYARIE